jgi:Adenosine-deaminase (editase) domain
MPTTQPTQTAKKEFASHVARMALQHYDSLPQKSKPKSTEWTVYAAIVAEDDTIMTTKDNDRMWVVSSATGTKCCVIPSDYRDSTVGLCVLTDCHAEILARRGLQRVLYSEMKYLNQQQPHNNNAGADNRKKLLRIAGCDKGSTKFRLRDGVTLHLYVSDSPCGDASIYSMIQRPNDGSTIEQIQFTGAKVILSDQTASTAQYDGPLIQEVAPGVRLVREQQSQLLGSLRTKSGRSNLEPHLRSQSMSCSDKITRWTILGLQGSLLERHLVDPLRLTSIVVSKDPRADSDSQLKALQRAVVDRSQDTLQVLHNNVKTGCLGSVFVGDFLRNAESPSIYLVDASFERGKARSAIPPSSTAASRKRKLETVSVPACGLCSNWQCSDEAIELVVGARGLRHGRIPKAESDFVCLSSRLSRKAFVAQSMLEEPISIAMYREMKRHHMTSTYCSVRNFALSCGPLAGWLVGDTADTNERITTTDREESQTS